MNLDNAAWLSVPILIITLSILISLINPVIGVVMLLIQLPASILVTRFPSLMIRVINVSSIIGIGILLLLSILNALSNIIATIQVVASIIVLIVLSVLLLAGDSAFSMLTAVVSVASILAPPILAYYLTPTSSAASYVFGKREGGTGKVAWLLYSSVLPKLLITHTNDQILINYTELMHVIIITIVSVLLIAAASMEWGRSVGRGFKGVTLIINPIYYLMNRIYPALIRRDPRLINIKIISEDVATKFINEYWNKLIGMDEAKNKVLRLASSKSIRGLLLHGSSGTGKTALAAGLLGILVLNGWVGVIIDSSMWSDIDSIYRYLSDLDTPAVVLIDEVDAVAVTRDKNLSNERLIKLLHALDSAYSRLGNHVLTIATTNRVNDLDPAILRSGRLGDAIINVDKPPIHVVEKIISEMCRRSGIEVGDWVGEAAKKIETGAEADALIRCMKEIRDPSICLEIRNMTAYT